jgi:hypothetical protein
MQTSLTPSDPALAVDLGDLWRARAPRSRWAAASTKRVLVLCSTSQDAPMANAGDSELPRILEQGLEQDVVYYAEYIDQGGSPTRDIKRPSVTSCA